MHLILMYLPVLVQWRPPQGTPAMRNTKRGSWFIQELNTTLRLHARDTHLADILVQVNRNVSYLHVFDVQ